MLTFARGDPYTVTLAVTKCGIRMESPAVLPGAKLTAEERATLLDHGWKMHEGLYYHPNGVRSGYFHRLKARSKAAAKAREAEATEVEGTPPEEDGS